MPLYKFIRQSKLKKKTSNYSNEILKKNDLTNLAFLIRYIHGIIIC